jgi:hypothetical protein
VREGSIIDAIKSTTAHYDTFRCTFKAITPMTDHDGFK